MKILDSLIKTLNETQNIPHILFYGEVHSGKRKAVNYLLNHIYSLEERKQYCMFLECATFKGIKVIRDEIKEFAKQQTCNRVFFKSIVLYDAENLTIDAQYSLRRCIEIYSKTTRFFIVTSNRDRLLNPICSRFIHIFIPKIQVEPEPVKWSQNMKKLLKEENIIELSTKLYNKGIYGDMLMDYYKDDSDKYLKLRFNYEKICRELKNEIWIIYYILDYFKNDL